MLKRQNHHNLLKHAKKGSIKATYIGPLASGLNRRAFLKTSSAITLLAGLTACKPSVPSPETNTKANLGLNLNSNIFTSAQKKILDSVLIQLFPADGNGPSASDINAIGYLEWAMSDPHNIEDGDPEFISKGIGWLNDLAEQTQGDGFVLLSNVQKEKVLKQIAASSAGENWLSILLYYLREALLLDPVYGGNTNQAGWQWLEHQAGFPQPEVGKTYRDFD